MVGECVYGGAGVCVEGRGMGVGVGREEGGAKQILNSTGKCSV